MNKPKIAILIDLASLRINCEGYKKLAEKLETQFEIAYVKFYSYVAKRNRDFNEFVAAKGYDAVTPIASRRRNKLDTRQIIDATLIGENSTVDAVAFAVGEGDILPIISYLKLQGKDVYQIGVYESTYIDAFTGYYNVPESYLREGYAAPTKPAAAKKKVTRVAPAQPAASDMKYNSQANSLLAKYRKK